MVSSEVGTNFFIQNIWTNFAVQKQNYRIKSFVILIEAIIAGEDDWVKPPSYPVIFFAADY